MIITMNTPHSFFGASSEQRQTRVRDVTWDRVLFQPPALSNPRTVFDAASAFRTQTIQRPVRSRPPIAR